MKLTIENKTGIRLLYSVGGPVAIYDEKGRLYHYRERGNYEKGIHVNLEPGAYEFEPAPLKWKFVNWLNKKIDFDLPSPEKRFEGFSGKKFDVVYNPDVNYTPARTRIDKGLIEFTDRMSDLPLPQIRFITFHEMGHNLYFTEWKCDVFAFYLMMKKGYGISQCWYALKHVMKEGPKKDFRLKKIAEYIHKIKTY